MNSEPQFIAPIPPYSFKQLRDKARTEPAYAEFLIDQVRAARTALTIKEREAASQELDKHFALSTTELTELALPSTGVGDTASCLKRNCTNTNPNLAWIEAATAESSLAP